MFLLFLNILLRILVDFTLLRLVLFVDLSYLGLFTYDLGFTHFFFLEITYEVYNELKLIAEFLAVFHYISLYVTVGIW